MIVTKSDKSGNTLAWQRYKEGFKSKITGKLEGGMLPDPRKGYQLRQFATFRGGITRTMNPFLGKGQGALSGPTPLARQTPRLIRQGAKSLAKRILSRGRLG